MPKLPKLPKAFVRAFSIHACDFLGEDPRDYNLTDEEVAFNRNARQDNK